MENRAEEAIVQRAKQLPASTQFAIVRCLPNIPYGSNWGFASLEDVKDRYENLKSDKNLIARKIANGCIIEVLPNYLLKAADTVQKGIIKAEDITKMKTKIAEAYASFEKYLKTSAKKGSFEGQVGIYCVNSSTNIAVKGVTYPAFRVNIQSAVKLLAENNYSIAVKGVGYVPAKSINGESIGKLFSSMLLSPTNTGVFIKIKKN